MSLLRQSTLQSSGAFLRSLSVTLGELDAGSDKPLGSMDMQSFLQSVYASQDFGSLLAAAGAGNGDASLDQQPSLLKQPSFDKALDKAYSISLKPDYR